MAAAAAKKKSAPSVEMDGLKREVQLLVATTSQGDPDHSWTLTNLADQLGHPVEAVAAAVRLTLEEAGYSRRDDIGPAWLDNGDFRVAFGAQPTLFDMPTVSTYQGIPIREVSLKVASTKVMNAALAKACSEVWGRVQIVVDAVVQPPALYDPNTKKESSSDETLGMRVNLKALHIRLLEEDAPVTGQAE